MFDGNGVARHVNAVNQSDAAGGAHARGENADGRRLARTVGAEQAEELAARYVQIDSVNGLDFDGLTIALQLISLAQVLNGNNSFHFASPVSLSFCITRFRFRAFVRCFSCGTAMACPFGDALAYELAQVFDVVTSFTPEISA